MKKMTCYELGGACDKEFYASTFKEMAQQSRDHTMDMFKKGDQDHLKAMEEMKKFMDSPQAMLEWMNEKEALFNSLEDLS